MPSPKPAQGIPLPRRKACGACSHAKVRCDHEMPMCKRCKVRGLSCVYPGREGSGTSAPAINQAQALPADSIPSDVPTDLFPITPTDSPGLGFAFTLSTRDDDNQRWPSQHAGDSREAPPTTITADSLACSIDVASIECRWLRAYIPDAKQQVKNIPLSINRYVGRMLKSSAAMVIHGSGIPLFINQSQLQHSTTYQPLANCFSLLRVCDSRTASDRIMATELVEQEMHRLFEQHTTYDALTLLAAFQSYLLYIITLLLHLNQKHSPTLRQAIINNQQLTSASAAHGVVTTAEQQHARPKWDFWITIEAKRRTIYTMYLLDNYLCTIDGLPVFLGTELRGLPAPASGRLWRTTSLEEWQKAYNAHSCAWDEGGLAIDELWPVPSALSEHGVGKRRKRVDRWLEGVDEFGTILYALTASTHGG